MSESGREPTTTASSTKSKAPYKTRADVLGARNRPEIYILKADEAREKQRAEIEAVMREKREKKNNKNRKKSDSADITTSNNGVESCENADENNKRSRTDLPTPSASTVTAGVDVKTTSEDLSSVLSQQNDDDDDDDDDDAPPLVVDEEAVAALGDGVVEVVDDDDDNQNISEPHSDQVVIEKTCCAC